MMFEVVLNFTRELCDVTINSGTCDGLVTFPNFMQPSSTLDLVGSLEDQDDVASWINNILDTQEEQDVDTRNFSNLTELDQQVTQLLATLEIACQDTSTQLEHIIDDVSRGVPRLTYDLHFMRDGALTLQTALTKAQAKSKESVPDETSAALDRLQYLDTVKGRMEAAREVLREAESWSSLEMEVTSLLAEKSYEKAAERLNEASKSMAVFQNTPEYESRRTLMVSLQNQLEASLSSALVAAINSQDVAVCRNFFSIFSNIQRESEFRNYYNGSRRASLVTQWQSIQLLDCDSRSPSSPPPSTPTTFTIFLGSFYTSFLAMLNAERASIPSIFPDPAPTLSTLITSTLSALQPTFSERLASLYSHHGGSALRELIAAYKATEEFAASTDKIIEKIQYSAVLLSPVPAAASPMENIDEGTPQLQRQKSHSRKRSARMSMSWRTNPRRSSMSGGSITKGSSGSLLADVVDLDWDQELFQPFLDFQVDYASLERRLLDAALDEIVSAENRSDVTESDRARLLRERSVDVFSVADESLGRCMSFTHGYGAVGLVQALDHFLKSFVDIWTADITSAQSSSFSGRGASDSEGDLSDLDYTAEDWSDIQMSLHLLASARAVLDRLSVFESKLRSNLIQVATSFRLARNDPSGLSISGTTKGEGLLIIQSSLNSAELHELLKSVESDSQSRHSGAATPLLVEARAAVSTFAKACQRSLQGTILSPLRKHLASYPSSQIWSALPNENSKRGVNDLHVPTFSLSPSDVIQRLAEGLLNLPRLFEVYADDDALSFSLETLPYIDAELLKELSEQPEIPPQAPPGHMRRASLTQPIKSSMLSPEAISSAWLSSLGHSILSHLTSKILPKIRTLTTAGAAQLSSDLGYLSNIVRAINVEYDDLDRWKDYTSISDEEGRRMVAEKEGDAILVQISRMRGWL